MLEILPILTLGASKKQRPAHRRRSCGGSFPHHCISDIPEVHSISSAITKGDRTKMLAIIDESAKTELLPGA